MRHRLALTIIWLLSLVVNLFLIEWYRHVTDEDGKAILGRQDVLRCAGPVIALYAPYLTGMFVLWYFKPFPPPRSGVVEQTRFWLAACCALILNGVVIYYVAYIHIHGVQQAPLREYVVDGIKLAGLLSFLVAPANAYFFGMKYPVAP